MHNMERMIHWIAKQIFLEWQMQQTASLALSLLEDSKYKLMDFQPAEPDVGIQCAQWLDFEFEEEEERQIMVKLFEFNESTFHFVHDLMLAQLNETHAND